MNEKHWEDCIKKAVAMEMENHVLPDPGNMWQGIMRAVEFGERVLKTPGKKQKTTATLLKAAAVLVILVLASGIVAGPAQIGEATPFGWVLQGLQKITGDDYVLVRFNFGEEETAQKSMPPPPPPPDTEEQVVYQTNLTDTSLVELLEIYPGALYYPHSIADTDLKSAQYLQSGDSWIIFLDFLVDQHNILFQQQDILGKGTAAVAYGDDAEVSFHRLEGVEYMAAALRYGIVNIRWTKENKLFELTGNLTVEDALAVAQSAVPYCGP